MYIRDFSSLQNEPMPIPNTSSVASGQPRNVIPAVFAMLDRENIRWCIVHGYDGLPEIFGSDIDCIIDKNVTPHQLVTLFRRNETKIGARLVRANGFYITLACTSAEGLPVLVTFDFAVNYCYKNHMIGEGERILNSRRRLRDFWIASPDVEFTCLLQRLIMKRKLDASATQRLSSLFRQAPDAVRDALTEIWPLRAGELRKAAASGDWEPVNSKAEALRRELRTQLIRQNFGHYAGQTMLTQAGRVDRLLRPPGINVVLLGPDGAGKSSTIDALEKALAPLFAKTEVRGFAPSLRQILKRPPPSTSTPHALKPRSLPTSLIRAGYWLLHGTLGHASVYWAKVKSTLVLNDRHYVDILVDPVRYRYGGPRWLLQFIWRLMPKPDLIILLYGPAEVLQARKRELTVEETARQCRDYLALVQPMRNSHIIDATQPFSQVLQTITGIILDARQSARS